MLPPETTDFFLRRGCGLSQVGDGKDLEGEGIHQGPGASRETGNRGDWGGFAIVGQVEELGRTARCQRREKWEEGSH